MQQIQKSVNSYFRYAESIAVILWLIFNYSITIKNFITLYFLLYIFVIISDFLKFYICSRFVVHSFSWLPVYWRRVVICWEISYCLSRFYIRLYCSMPALSRSWSCILISLEILFRLFLLKTTFLTAIT